MEDVERGTDALAQARALRICRRQPGLAQLGEGYLTRAAQARRRCEELEPLTRAARPTPQAIEYFSKATSFGNVAQRLRDAQRRLKEVQQRIAQLSTVARFVPTRDRRHERHLHYGRRTRRGNGAARGSLAPGPSRC